MTEGVRTRNRRAKLRARAGARHSCDAEPGWDPELFFSHSSQRLDCRSQFPPRRGEDPAIKGTRGLALSWGGIAICTSSKRVIGGCFRWDCAKGSLSIPPTIFDSLMTRRGLGGCDPQRDRGGGRGRGHHISWVVPTAASCSRYHGSRTVCQKGLICRLASSRPSPTSCPRGESEMVVVGGPFPGRQQDHQRGRPAVLCMALCGWGPDTQLGIKSATSVTSLNRVLGSYLWTTTP